MNGLPAVLVLGHGEMGRAMEVLLADRVDLDIWNRSPRSGLAAVVLEEVAARANVVIFCLPTAAHDAVLEKLHVHLRPGCICLSVAKGLDEKGRPVTRILADAIGGRIGYGVLYGPMIAEEIQEGRHAFAELGFHGETVAEVVMTLFAGTRLHVTASADMLGINWAVVLKNIYAMAFGVADELGCGDNVRGWLATAAVRELHDLVQTRGGRSATAYGLAGLGDFITTATSEHSHHHTLGRRLARGEAAGIEGEAIRTLAAMEHSGLPEESSFPLFRWIHALVRDPSDARQRFEALLSSPATTRGLPRG